MAKKFLYVPQGQIGRWQYGYDGYGLYTDGFYNCVIIVIKSANRISLAHIDPAITLEDIKTELAWVGEHPQAVLYYKDNQDAEETLADLFKLEPQLKGIFEIRKIEKEKLGGQIVPSASGKVLPDGSPLPEFVSHVISVDDRRILATKHFLFGYQNIQEQDKIQQLYEKYQKPENQTNIRRGKNFGAADESEIVVNSNPHLLQILVNAATLGGDENLTLIKNKINRGMDINIRLGKERYTLLCIAAAEGRENIVTFLLARNAGVNLGITTGSTPIFLAAGRGHRRIVEILLTAGADPNIPTSSGELAGMLPFHIAQIRHHEEICQLLARPIVSVEQKTFWIFATTNKDAIGANIAENFFINTPQDKRPGQWENCFKTKSDAERALQAFFEKGKSISAGGPKKAFIFELSQSIANIVKTFRDKADASSLNFVGYEEYTYDRTRHELVKAEAEEEVPAEQATASA